jgi:uncharacterized protein (TIGR02145 family)
MYKKFFTIVICTILALGLYSQRSAIDLTFTAVDSTSYVRLDSIKVINRTQGDQAMIYWPDTTITVNIDPGDLLLYIGYSTYSPTGTGEIIDDRQDFQLFQNHPNPFTAQSMVPIYVPKRGTVDLMVSDPSGRVLFQASPILAQGRHSFRFISGGSLLYFLTARYEGVTQAIKMLGKGTGSGNDCMLEYAGSAGNLFPLKDEESAAVGNPSASGISDYPLQNSSYTFQFATNIPCPGTPTVEYEGKIYNTIQIFSQCWLKENLNVGVMIPGSGEMSDDGVKEKYCPGNLELGCDMYGGLYQWDEMMQYTMQPRVQGICPPGWHLPDDEEWNVLEGAVDGYHGIGDPEWDIAEEWRGFDAGTKLKSTTGWNFSGNGSDQFGFTALPAGMRIPSGSFAEAGASAFGWASSGGGLSAWFHMLSYGSSKVYKSLSIWQYGMSVRCIRDQW